MLKTSCVLLPDAVKPRASSVRHIYQPLYLTHTTQRRAFFSGSCKGTQGGSREERHAGIIRLCFGPFAAILPVRQSAVPDTSYARLCGVCR